MQTLIYTSVTTSVAIGLVAIYGVWFEMTELMVKILITLCILFVGQLVAYLVVRDIKEESHGKDNGTIAQ